MRVQLHNLELVYPPISNQEAEWLKNDPEVIEQLKQSNLYFIGQKPKSIFVFGDDLSDRLKALQLLQFKIKVGNKVNSVEIDLDALIKYHETSYDSFEKFDVELGPKLIRIWLIPNSAKDRILLDWFTTEKLLFDFTRNKNNFIKGLKDVRALTEYNLHYIGISKKDDSFKRLVIKPHDKRLRILSNEHSLSSGSRLTDEIIFFFFDIKSLEIKQYLKESDFDEIGFNELEDKIKIIADAEKALVSILECQYNEIKFKTYPISEDGLFNSKVERYSYSINEDLTFITTDNKIYGERANYIDQINSDFISIDIKSKDVKLNRIEDI